MVTTAPEDSTNNASSVSDVTEIAKSSMCIGCEKNSFGPASHNCSKFSTKKKVMIAIDK